MKRILNQPDPIIQLLLQIIDEGFDKQAWHGPNLCGALRGVDAATAARRLPGRKTIWEQALHAAYWKRMTLNKLSTTERFPRRGSNWPRMPDSISEAAWKQDLQLLSDIHAKFRAAVESLDPRRLEDPKLRRMVHGAAFHDIYHSGQIRALRKMLTIRSKDDSSPPPAPARRRKAGAPPHVR